ncbi:NAD-dependent epimerase/dehydratase family protein [Tsuneonella sp. SYSU-LHT278]|uniref:NAD-dependent epimerase/dehydratase family protein n=1 Tax=Tsuneonella sediminis TaxID=3416089 RepID=UPI003F79E2AA
MAGPLVLVGGDSRAAAAIAARSSSRKVVLIARRDGPGERVLISDYRKIPDGAALANATVINCVGTDRGDPEDLAALNVEVPIAWAGAAEAAGARQFIQISSFSVYGRRAAIGSDTPPAPESGYGMSKRDAETALEGTGAMATSILRVPILVSPAGAAGEPDKLARLASLSARIRAVPAPRARVERSMISYDAMARAVELLEAEPRPLAIAADPQPFTYDLLAEVAREAGLAVARVPVPQVAVRLLAGVSPGLADRLFASSVLAAEANLLAGQEGFVPLREVIASHFAARR